MREARRRMPSIARRAKEGCKLRINPTKPFEQLDNFVTRDLFRLRDLW